MSVARHRFGPQFVVHVAVASETAIRAGDALYLHEGEARPASSFTWDDNLAATRASFNDQFLGIALADHPADSGDESLFPVDISPLAVYEMDCVGPEPVGGGPRGGHFFSGRPPRPRRRTDGLRADAVGLLGRKRRGPAVAVQLCRRGAGPMWAGTVPPSAGWS